LTAKPLPDKQAKEVDVSIDLKINKSFD